VCDNPSGPPELHPVISEDHVALSVVFYVECSFVFFSFGPCIICAYLIYGFCLSLWYRRFFSDAPTPSM